MTTHYLDCKLTVAKQDYYFMFSKLYKLAHSIIGRNPQLNIGLSFPEYNDGQLGHILRFFADDTVLKKIEVNEGVLLLEDCQIIKRSEIKETPLNSRHVRFYRNRKRERQSSKYQAKRTLKFEQFLAKKYASSISSEEQKHHLEKIKNQYAQKTDTPQYLCFQSASNGYNYSLSICKSEFIDKQVGEYNSFGLSKHGSTVPFGF